MKILIFTSYLFLLFTSYLLLLVLMLLFFVCLNYYIQQNYPTPPDLLLFLMNKWSSDHRIAKALMAHFTTIGIILPRNQNVPFLWEFRNGRRKLININNIATDIYIEYDMSNDINERELELYHKLYSFWYYSNPNYNDDIFYTGFHNFIINLSVEALEAFRNEAEAEYDEDSDDDNEDSDDVINEDDSDDENYVRHVRPRDPNVVDERHIRPRGPNTNN